jgi:cytochrome P450
MSTAAVPKLKADDVWQSSKPFSEIPGPKGLPLIGNVVGLVNFLWNREDWHTQAKKQFAKYGPIFKQKTISLELVHLAAVDAVETVHRLDGKYPRRFIVNCWKNWRAERGLAFGILINDGSEWKRMRTILDKRMLRPQHIAVFANTFNEVITDFIARLRRIRDEKGGGQTIPNMDHELFHWSLETIGAFLYEVRIGGLSDARDPRMNSFIQAVQDVLETTGTVNIFPPQVNRIFFRKAQKLHEDCWDRIFTTTQYLVEEKVKKLKDVNVDGEKNSVTGFLSYLLLTEMSLEEIHANLSELMMAAVDTTSNTVQWLLYELARHENVQKILHDEVMSILPTGQPPTYDDIHKMPYLRAIVKEALRMYPVTGVSTRVLNSDMVLCGYQVPAGTGVISHTSLLGRNPNLYVEPDSFMPERWLRTGDSDHVHSFAWLPFGFGPRMCIGRRIAELEMHLLLARISQTFVLKPDEKTLLSKYRGVIVPERPVNVTFVDRSL